MAASQCRRCGLIRQDCQCPRQRNDQPLDITPACCSICYLFLTIILFFISFYVTGKLTNHKGFCYLELFANSISISNTNANVSTADWRIGLVAKSPLTHCKIKLHTIKSRLLRGHKVISDLPILLDDFGQLVTSAKSDKPVINVDFKNVVTSRVIGGVVWDYRLEFELGMKSGDTDGFFFDKNIDGFLMVVCGDIPVKFIADPVGNMVGSLLGNMRRCDYVYQYELIKHSV